jgi:hypothetical protein
MSYARHMPLATHHGRDRMPMRRAIPTTRSTPWSACLFKENPTSCLSTSPPFSVPVSTVTAVLYFGHHHTVLPAPLTASPPPCTGPRALLCFRGALRADAMDSLSPENRRAVAVPPLVPSQQ